MTLSSLSVVEGVTPEDDDHRRVMAKHGDLRLTVALLHLTLVVQDV